MEMRYVLVFLLIGFVVVDVSRAFSGATNLQAGSLKTTLSYLFQYGENFLTSKLDEEEQKVMETGLTGAKKTIQECFKNERKNYTSERNSRLTAALACIDQFSETTSPSTSLETCKSNFSKELEQLKDEHTVKMKQCVKTSLCTTIL